MRERELQYKLQQRGGDTSRIIASSGGRPRVTEETEHSTRAELSSQSAAAQLLAGSMEPTTRSSRWGDTSSFDRYGLCFVFCFLLV